MFAMASILFSGCLWETLGQPENAECRLKPTFIPANSRVNTAADAFQAAFSFCYDYSFSNLLPKAA
ncbi:hypothetical protein HMPREF9120_00285 [Neisseria sp. oral taxon 020 str. F0370]|nr:hypothetical protein HMPREF9120_00285 [Neisseria sp. oral taxon 020 str. F0370]